MSGCKRLVLDLKEPAKGMSNEKGLQFDMNGRKVLISLDLSKESKIFQADLLIS